MWPLLSGAVRDEAALFYLCSFVMGCTADSYAPSSKVEWTGATETAARLC